MTAPLIGISTGFTDYGDYLGVAFSRPLEDRGAIPVVVPFVQRPYDLLGRLDGLVLAVGRDLEPARFNGNRHRTTTLHSPLRDTSELALTSEAIAAGLPLLGICRGMQVINVAFGGSLHADHSVLPGPAARHPGGDWERWERVVAARLSATTPPQHPEHPVQIAPDSVLACALGTRAIVNSYHHQSIAELGEGIEVTARAPDGVVEAIELPAATELCLGVQWELQEQPDSPVFDLFVDRARRYESRKCSIR
jgi:putative glutamine amidotransferase